MSDLVKRLRDQNRLFRVYTITDEAADHIEKLEKKIKLFEQSQAAYALAGLGVDVMAAHNAGLEGLKAGCKEERLRAEKAEKRIEALEAALREIAAPSKVMAKGEDMEKALVTLLSSHRNTAIAALAGEKKNAL